MPDTFDRLKAALADRYSLRFVVSSRMRLFISPGTALLALSWTVGAFGLPAPQEQPVLAGPPAKNYRQTLGQLLTLAPRGDRVASVLGLTLTRDAARFTLDEGLLYFLTPVAGRTVGAVFVGTGTASITPPTVVERAQLERFYHARTLERPFTTMLLVFADSTDRELESRLTFGDGQVVAAAREQVKEALKYLTDRKRRFFHSDLLTAFLNGHENDLFYAHFAEKKSKPMFFFVNPYEDEAVSIRRRDKKARGNVTEIVCQFHRSAYRDQGAEARGAHDLIAIDHYAIESSITDNLDYSAAATMRIRALQPEVRWVRLRLYSELEVDSVLSEDGRPVVFERGEESAGLWLQLEPAPSVNEVRTITVFYAGKLLRRESILPPSFRRAGLPKSLDRWIFLLSPNSWYPRYGDRPSMMELTFHSPRELTLISVGDSVYAEVGDKVTTTRWVTTTPTAHASFNIGDFDRFDVSDERIPPVSVLLAEDAHFDLRTFLFERNIRLLEQKDMEEQVATDIANSLAFFQERYGEPLTGRFYATEIPYGHGQAFPGLLHLSWATFQSTSERGDNELFRAHEMAHQWWGIGVEPASYRDWWLAEGLADFSGLWYMQMILEDNEKYFRFLREWREQILDRGQDLAPIWLGPRAAVSDEPGDYNLVVYRKGAWVVQMLRNMLVDLRTMKDDAFIAMMRDFYGTYRGKRASTDDFQRVVERHTGLPMDWFFDQWVRSSAVPTYRLRHRVERTPEGTFSVRLRIAQVGVPNDFRMLVPLFLDFGDDQSAMLRIWITGPVTEIELPPLPLKPRRIVLNPLESVLAKVKDDGSLR